MTICISDYFRKETSYITEAPWVNLFQSNSLLSYLTILIQGIYFITMCVFIFGLSVYYFLCFKFFPHSTLSLKTCNCLFLLQLDMVQNSTDSKEYAVKSFFPTRVPKHPVSLLGRNKCFLFPLYSFRVVLCILSKYIDIPVLFCFFLKGSMC